MQISPSSSGGPADEVCQALLLKKAIQAESDQQLTLINSVSTADHDYDNRTVGRLLDEKV